MRLSDDLGFSTLSWVKPELDQSLARAREALQAYAENGADEAQIDQCLAELHQVQGTLRMVELYGAAMVVDEMETVARALREQRIRQRDDAFAVLLGGMVQLPDYLERLQGGHKDIPIVLLPLLNDLRACRGEKLLSESVLFSPDLDAPLPDAAAGALAALPEARLKSEATQQRFHYQRGLLHWIRGEQPDKALGDMIAVLDRLRALVVQDDARRLFWIAAGALDAVRAGGIDASAAVKLLFGRVDREIRKLIQFGEPGFRADPPRDLVKNLLYYIAGSNVRTARTAEIDATYRLRSLLPTEDELEHAKGSLVGKNRALLDTVSAAIKEDLLKVKDALDLHLRSGAAQAELAAQVESLDRIGDTLGMLGLGEPRKAVQAQREVLARIASGEIPAEERALLDVAGALLFVESSLDDNIDRLGAEDRPAPAVDEELAVGSVDLPAVEVRKIIETLMKEAQANLARAREAVVAFIESPWDHRRVDEVPQLLNEVSGALSMLAVEGAPELLGALRQFIEVELLRDRHVPDARQLDLMADAFASIEYYLEAAREHRLDRASILDTTRRSLEALGYWPPPSPSTEWLDGGACSVVETPVAPAAVEPDAPIGSELGEIAGAAFEVAGAPPPAPAAEATAGVATRAPEGEAGEPVEPATAARITLAATEPGEGDGEWVEIEEEVEEEVAPAVPSGLPSPPSTEIDAEIREIFLEEVGEEIEQLRSQFPQWTANRSDQELLKPIRRSFHTLKGSGRLVGAVAIGEFSWKVENMLNRVLDGTIAPSDAVSDLLEKAIGMLPELRAALAESRPPRVDIAEVMMVADELAAGREAWVGRRAKTKVRRVRRVWVPRALAAGAGPAAPGVLADLAAWSPASVDAVEPPAPVAPDAAGAVATEAAASEAAAPAPAAVEPEVSQGGPTPGEPVAPPEALDTHATAFAGPVVPETGAAIEAAAEPSEVQPFEWSLEIGEAFEPVQAEGTETVTRPADEAAAGEPALEPATEGDVSSVAAMADEAPVQSTTTEPDAIGVGEPASPAPETSTVEAAGGLVPALDPLLLEILRTEVGGHIETLRAYVADADSGRVQPVDDAVVHAIHTMHGALSMSDVPGVSEVASPLEAYVKRLRAQRLAPDATGVEALREATRFFEAILALLDQPGMRVPAAHDLGRRIAALRDQLPDSTASWVEAVEEPAVADTVFEAGTFELASELETSDSEPSSEFDFASDLAALGELEAALEAIADAPAAEPIAPERAGVAPSDAAITAEAPAAPIEAAETTEAPGPTETPVSAATSDVTIDLELPEPIAPEVAEGTVFAAAPSAAAESPAVERPEAVIGAIAPEAIAHDVAETATPASESPTAGESPAVEVSEALIGALAPEAIAHDVAEIAAFAADLPAAAETAPAPSIEAGDIAEVVAEAVASAEAATAPAPQDDGSLRWTAVESVAIWTDERDPNEPLHLPDVDPDLVDLFVEEANEQLDVADGAVARLRERPADRDATADLQRELHTLKGNARAIGLSPIGDLTHAIETSIEAVVAGSIAVDRVLIESLERGFDRLHAMVNRVAQRQALAHPRAAIAHFEALARGGTAALPAVAPTVETPSAEIPAIEARHSAEAAVAARPLAEAPTEAPPPPAAEPAVRSVRDIAAPSADQLAEEATLRPPQELIRVRSDLLDALVNFAGEVAIYRSRLEQQIGSYRANLTELDQTVTRLRGQLRQLEIETEAQILSRYQREAEEAGEVVFDPLELDRFSTLQQLSRALSESVNDLIALQTNLDDLTRQSETLLLQQSRVSTELQEGLMRTRMVPFDSVVPFLRRLLRQTGDELGKRAQLRIEGAQGEMDRNLLERMKAPLEHMLRNALAHGIESPEERIALGKPPEGEVKISVGREATEVVIKVSDDGRGMNREAIRAKAIQRGLLREDAQLSDRDLFAFVLESGFSTAEQVTQIAGRGVGMDVVASEIKQLGGSLGIDSALGRGTTFTVRLPFTLAVTQAVLVRVGEHQFAVPMSAVQGIARIPRAEYAKRMDEGHPVFSYAGEEYSMHDLAQLLSLPVARRDQDAQLPLLLVRAGDQRAAVRIDGVLGSREVVVKPVGPQINSVPGIFGATIMGDGSVVMILDLAPLLRRALSLREQGAVERALEAALAEAVPGLAASDEAVEELVPIEAPPMPEPRRRPLVAVVDDSITMRRVTSRVLERNDIEVITAKDGLDAVERFQERIPDLILLDIEMPRMDGYELATYVRNDVRLRHIPIIMITSRTGEKHRQRAQEIGVNRYLGKPYQEPELLKNVAELLNLTHELR
jgi:chemosensory pili system protein ChpA (sensor histidine kinase/response regulator)